MRRRKRNILIITLALTIICIIPVIIGSDFLDRFVNAEDAGWSEETTPEEPSGSNGSPETYLVLEIVPYKGMGEMGYLVGGEEPVDEELFTKDNANGDLSFLGDSVTAYPSYVEKSVPSSGDVEKGWIPIKTYFTQNGYFQYMGEKGGTYQKVAGNVYTQVTNGQGQYNAKLGTENTSIYNKEWNQTNQKNVNAYFVYGKPQGVALQHTAYSYAPCSVKRNPDHKGNYNYNSATKTFFLNKGKGAYDVLFARNYSGSNQYYMMSDYEIVKDFSGEYSWSLTYEYVGETGGNYIKESNGMTFNYQANNEYNYRYKWVESNEALNKPTNYYQEGTPGTTSEKIWVKGMKLEKLIQYDYKVAIVNNEWFKRLTLGIKPEDCDNYKVDVITMTPAELNLPENQHYLKEAHIFYISDNYSHNISYINLYESKSYEGLALPEEKKFNKIKDQINFGVNDLTWENTMKIFNRVAGVKEDGTLGGYRAAIVFDSTYYQAAVQGNKEYAPYHENVNVSFTWNSSGATVCNLAKLYIMLYQRDPVDFYKAFLSPTSTRKITQVSSTRNVTKTTGSFVRPDSSASTTSIEATFWNGNTFCAYILNDNGQLVALNINNAADKLIIEQKIPNYNILKNTTDIISNVLVLNGQDIFTSKFITPIEQLPKDVEEEVLIYLASINGGTVPSKISISGSIQLITNAGMGYGNNGSGGGTGNSGEDGTDGSNLRTYTSVLNIEPTADFTTSENNIRTMLQGHNLKIVNMTSAEFNSNIMDVNTHFDLIYIGAGAGRFNQSGSSTVFNKAEDVASVIEDNLNGSVYNKGDRIITTEGTKNYAGNDLTAQKIADLKEFLNAGYPIVLENSIYNLSTAVHASTNLYSFIQTTKANSTYTNLMNFANYTSSKITFMGKLIYTMRIVRPQIRMVNPVLEDSAQVNYLYVDPVTNQLTIQFALVPVGLVADSSIKYNADLYLDYNGDGVFDENTERLTAVSQDGSSNYGITESRFKTYRYNYDMTGRNGVYQWRVKVVRQATDANGIAYDTPIRSEITGYAACSNRQTIRVLHIYDNPSTDATAYSLENKVNDGSSLIRKYGGFGVTKLKDYDIIFDSYSVSQFLELYEEEPYTVQTAAYANQLAGYHVILMDNQSDNITNDKGALLNIKKEIEAGIGVIFTRGSVNYKNQSDYLSSSNYLFENQKTYPYLSYIGRPTSDNNNGNYNDDDPYYIYNFNISGYSGKMSVETTYHTTFITKSNEGADAQYPYKIGNAIKIANTSFQEDALIDYNKSSAIPLIGWYSLSDSRSPVVRSSGLVNETAANVYTGIYSSSPNDVKNNYYLFNRGKIYYTGIQLQEADRQYNDSEIQLFINTIIASYKTSGRIAKIAPVIQVTHPVPMNDTIILLPEDVNSLTKVPITFEITNSPSNMELSLAWDNSYITSGNWNTQIYKKTSANGLTEVTDLTEIENGTYVVYIPVSQLEGSHKLTINAENKEGVITKVDTAVVYSSIQVSIDNEELIKNVDKGEQYLYIDIDYAENGNEDNYLNSTDNIRVYFTVENLFEAASILIFDGTGVKIEVVGDIIHSTDGTNTYHMDTDKVPEGSYYIDIPAKIMSGISSEDVIITAKIGDLQSGQTMVTLLRRSLFQLD